ncbi:hypothetical protein OL548_33845 (plasmid) [Lysinibacillus sp. MHQ-1]|nr:hypothetical protein OL548_33845 [Lysinibacillus sp. MHQ-1]
MGWPDHPEIDSILEYAEKSLSPNLKLSSIKAKVDRNTHLREDLNALLELGSSDSRVGYYFREDVATYLLKGWPNNPVLLSACLSSIKEEYGDKSVLNNEIATKVLFKGYSEEKDVLDYVLTDLREGNRGLLLFYREEVWKLMRKNCQSEESIIETIDMWLQKKHVR